MVTTVEALRVIDRISQFSSAPERWQPDMRDTFVKSTNSEDDHSDYEFIHGLAQAAYHGIWALLLDHNAGDDLTRQAADLIETRIGVPDDPDFNYFAFDGGSVSAGLDQFDKWLFDQANARETSDRLRLVSIDTGADYYLSVLHPEARIDELIEHLASLGIGAERQTPGRAPIPQLAGTSRADVKKFVAAQLCNTFGYEVAALDVYMRRVDAEHSITITTGVIGGFDVGLIRSDIQDLHRATVDKHTQDWKVVVAEPARFLDRPHLPNDATQIEAYLNTWIPQLDSLANLAFIEQCLENPTNYFVNKYMMWLNQMLRGWNAPVDHDPLVQRIEQLKSHGEAWATREVAALERMRSWIVENPDGHDRRLPGRT